MVDPNLAKLAQDGVAILESALATAANATAGNVGGAVVSLLVTDAAAIKDALERLLLEVGGPIDAPALDPIDRANADAASAKDEDVKFPKTP